MSLLEKYTTFLIWIRNFVLSLKGYNQNTTWNIYIWYDLCNVAHSRLWLTTSPCYSLYEYDTMKLWIWYNARPQTNPVYGRLIFIIGIHHTWIDVPWILALLELISTACMTLYFWAREPISRAGALVLSTHNTRVLNFQHLYFTCTHKFQSKSYGLAVIFIQYQR